MGQSESGEASGGASPAIRAAAVGYLVLGLGFGIGSVVTLNHLARTGELPMTPWGFRSMSGPFEELGRDTFTALGWALVGVCALEVVAGAWLWQGRRRGVGRALATLSGSASARPWAYADGVSLIDTIVLPVTTIRS